MRDGSANHECRRNLRPYVRFLLNASQSLALFGESNGSERVVANPDRTAFFGDYFGIGGYSTGTENFRTERLDEYSGDCVNSRAFPARTAFFGIYLGRGRPSRSQVFTLELFPGGPPSDRNSEKLSASRLNACIGEDNRPIARMRQLRSPFRNSSAGYLRGSDSPDIKITFSCGRATEKMRY